MTRTTNIYIERNWRKNFFSGNVRCKKHLVTVTFGFFGSYCVACVNCEMNHFGVFYEEPAIKETCHRVQKPNFVTIACDSEKVV